MLPELAIYSADHDWHVAGIAQRPTFERPPSPAPPSQSSSPERRGLTYLGAPRRPPTQGRMIITNPRRINAAQH
jgi:hypothetical protein